MGGGTQVPVLNGGLELSTGLVVSFEFGCSAGSIEASRGGGLVGAGHLRPVACQTRFVKSSDESVDRAFRVTIPLKGVDGAVEVIGGVLLLLISPSRFSNLRFVSSLRMNWLKTLTISLPATFLHSASQLSRSSTVYGGVYLLIHGAAKLVLVVLVLKDKLWAYPMLIILLLVFIVYQADTG